MESDSEEFYANSCKLRWTFKQRRNIYCRENACKKLFRKHVAQMPCCCGCFIYLSRFINWFNSRFHKIPWVCKRILILELTSLARFFIPPHVISFNLTLSSYKLQTSLYQTGNHIFSCLAIWNNTLSLIVTNETNKCNNHRVKFICQSYRIKMDFQCRAFFYVRKTCVQFNTTLFFFACAKRRPVH